MSKYIESLKKRMQYLEQRKESYERRNGLVRHDAPPDTDTTRMAVMGLQSLPWYSGAWVLHALADGEHHKVARFLQLNYGYSFERCSAIKRVVEHYLSKGYDTKDLMENNYIFLLTNTKQVL